MTHLYRKTRSRSTRRQHRPEQELGHTVGQFLDVALPENGMWCHYPAGGYRKPIEAAILKAQGVRSGFPDVLVFHNGRVFGIELKAGDRTLTPIQRQMHQRLEACGVPCCVATTPDDVETFLSQHMNLRAHLGDPGRAKRGTS